MFSTLMPTKKPNHTPKNKLWLSQKYDGKISVIHGSLVWHHTSLKRLRSSRNGFPGSGGLFPHLFPSCHTIRLSQHFVISQRMFHFNSKTGASTLFCTGGRLLTKCDQWMNITASPVTGNHIGNIYWETHLSSRIISLCKVYSNVLHFPKQ